MVNKIISVVLIIIGAVFILLSVVSFLSVNAPASEGTAYKIGYYSFPVVILTFGVLFILFALRMRKKTKRRKQRKDLIDSLPS